MGRPLKKPGYDRDTEIIKLTAEAKDLFAVPYDDRKPRDKDAPTLGSVAKSMETTVLRARKLLITAGVYSTSLSRKVQELDREGMTTTQIMEETRLSKASVHSYLPYKKGVYYLPVPTLYSEQGKRYRDRKQAAAKLQAAVETGTEDEQKAMLWWAVIAFAEYPFQTYGRNGVGGVKFKYKVSDPGGNSGRKYKGISIDGYGNEMLIKGRGKSISRSTVELAFFTALRIQKEAGCVSGPKKLKVPGSGSYLYSLFLRLGVIKDK